MTLHWQPLGAGALDHERLWASVMLASAAMVAAVVATIGVPPLPCAFKLLTGWPCLTCGMTRGVLALLQGDLLSAARWNPLVPLAATGAAAYVTYALGAIAAGPRRLRVSIGPGEARLVRWGVCLSAGLVWAWLIVDGR